MRAKFFRIFMMACCAAVILSCENDADDAQPIVDPAEISAALVGSQWKISYYFDDKDETDNYGGYLLTFQEDGSISATNGDTVTIGTWSIADSDSTDNSTDGSVEFNIHFANPAIFEELTDDWDILRFSSAKIELKDVSGGDGTTDFLTLQKM